MYPMYCYQQSGQQIHRERIQTALGSRPEWPAPNVRPGRSATTWLRVRSAQALRTLAARFDLPAPSWTAARAHHSTSVD